MGGLAAVRASQTATSGDASGVVGETSSADGAGGVFGNLAGVGFGGVDLVLDGSADGLTDTDQDTVGGLSCSDGQVAQWDSGASQWICGTVLTTGTDDWVNVTGDTMTGNLDIDADLDLAGSVLKDGALFIHTSGGVNTAVGELALSNNTTGFRNTAIGRYSLQTNAEGYKNTAVGHLALNFNTIGSRNTATGDSALMFNERSDNTAIGFYALKSNSAGDFNTATGAYALLRNSSGFRNTAVGSTSLASNTTGLRNTAVGDSSLRYNETGNENSASGARALLENTTGFHNTATGASALKYNTTGWDNTATGSRAMLYNHDGYRDTAVGFEAMQFNETGNDNVAIGFRSLRYNARDESVAGENDTLRIGEIGGSRGLANVFIAGIEGVEVPGGSTVYIGSDGHLGTSSSSSRRFKKDINDLGALTEKLLSLRPVSYRFKEEIAGPGPIEYGLIAEEVAEIMPELVGYDDDGPPLTVRYHLLAPLLLNELQRQEKNLAVLTERLSLLEGERDE